MSRYSLRLILVCGLFCFSINAFGQVAQDCTINAESLFHTGEVLNGSGSDLVGVELVAWTHDAPGFSFEIAGGPDDIECRQNGTVSADIIGTGTALVNGDPGFSYLTIFEDNRGPESANEIRLCATLVQSPRTSNEGESSFSTPRTAVIPAVLPVVLGASGRGLARLHLDRMKCIYRGTGANYVF